ncbi:hypothetical protein N7533_001577 [Penicillium manginii]|jgi:hypothetical protein|uniref:uncharacterized protein n=1 Tax=Penicillium manginii TaxID=203109 RepID=UPI0025469297|nr:uncharacterized protein N7533_001577 [Penicillium manginii]KAJ5762896.1 hypothetical protein N7533_001577 [Penicillium manginii]
MKSFLGAIVTITSFFGLAMNASALPQFSSIEGFTVSESATTTADDLPSSTASGVFTSATGATSTDVPSLTEADISALPLIPVTGDDSFAIVQSSNTSLLETHPEVDVEPKNQLPDIPSVSDKSTLPLIVSIADDDRISPDVTNASEDPFHPRSRPGRM